MPKEISLRPDQRRYLAEEFQKHVDKIEISPGVKIFKRLGPSLQALIRDGIRCYFEVFPIIGDIKEVKGQDPDGNEIVSEFYVFKMDMNVPGFVNNKFKMVKEFPKVILDAK